MDMTGVLFLNRLTQNIPFADKVAVLLSSPLLGLGLLLGLTLFLAWRLRPVWLVVVVMGMGFGITDSFGHQILKPLVSRARPCLQRVDLFTPAGCGSGFSMPSLHAANAFAIAVLAAMLWPRTAGVVFPVALAIALSRIALAVHFPSDVVAGAMYGALIGMSLALTLGKRIRNRHSPYTDPRKLVRSSARNNNK